MEKLDSLSKIMLATGAINYMAVSIDSVNEQIKMTKLAYAAKPGLGDFDEVHGERIKARDEVLAEVVTDLAAVMEKLGDLINGHDCLCSVDVFATKAAFHVVVLGNDDTEGDYDNV